MLRNVRGGRRLLVLRRRLAVPKPKFAFETRRRRGAVASTPRSGRDSTPRRYRREMLLNDLEAKDERRDRLCQAFRELFELQLLGDRVARRATARAETKLQRVAMDAWSKFWRISARRARRTRGRAKRG